MHRDHNTAPNLTPRPNIPTHTPSRPEPSRPASTLAWPSTSSCSKFVVRPLEGWLFLKVFLRGFIAISSRPYHPVATSNILKKMTDPNLPTMRTRINGLALTLAEKTWAQDKLTANPDLATTWTPETDVDLIAFIKQSATQSAPPGPLWGSTGLSGSSSHSSG
ncbi:hypothetical protein PROFUN_15986 [Planoprotostelium fungivorum]|uniref:Uncharacterized protein n=1 Tax=Planoprotostelium fungivorum TaxID=1890364 RepID=A0A2P6MU09_9EUKA|nr:hypothetical protein PROFUN_15986 [Planoprotostelium fungivorum]